MKDYNMASYDTQYSSKLALIIFILQFFISLTVGGQLGALRRLASARSRDLPQAAPVNDILQQPAPPPPPVPPVCPCIRPPGGGPCFAYDQSYQAATLDEVLTNFVDTATVDPTQALNIYGQRPPVDNLNALKPNTALQCKSLECVACFHALSDRLSQQLSSSDAASLGLNGVSSFNPQVVGGSSSNSAQCHRLQQWRSTSKSHSRSSGKAAGATSGSGSGAGTGSASGSGSATGSTAAKSANNQPHLANNPAQPAAGLQPGAQPNAGLPQSGLNGLGGIPEDAAWLVGEEFVKPTFPSMPIPGVPPSPAPVGNNPAPASTANVSGAPQQMTTSVYSNSTYSNNSSTHFYSSTSTPRRQKRETPPSSGSGNIGVSTPLECNYKRGEPMDDNSGYVGLCNLCWSLRTLSPKYFPRYVNELSCDQSDNGCLSGYGKCRERYRSIDVLYNYGTDAAPKWQQYSINSPVACECQVQSGSALHNFISH